jgi:hypothetical protein
MRDVSSLYLLEAMSMLTRSASFLRDEQPVRINRSETIEVRVEDFVEVNDAPLRQHREPAFHETSHLDVEPPLGFEIGRQLS